MKDEFQQLTGYMLKTVMKKYFSFEMWHIQEKKTFLW